MNDEKLRHAMRTCLSGVTFAPARQEAVLRAVKGAFNQPMKRKATPTLALAILLALLITGGAVAAGLGIFGKMAASDNPGAPAYELNRLEEIATVYDIQASPAVQATVLPSAQPQTDYEALLSALEGQNLPCSLTLNQAYCDGERLYFSYTLEMEDMLWYRGEGFPTGMDGRGEFIAGKTYSEVWHNDILGVDEAITGWLDSHDASWIARSWVGMVDGADLEDGTYMTPIEGERGESTPTRLTGFYTVRLPAGYEPGDTLTFVLSTRTYMELIAQNADGVYACFDFPMETQTYAFTIPVGGSVTWLHGDGRFEQYSASAQVSISRVTVSGKVMLNVPVGWTASFGQNGDGDAAGDHILTYQLVAGGQALHNYDGSLAITGDGALTIGVQCDIPYSGVALYLRPVYSLSGPHPEEDILLVQNIP